MGLRFDDDFRDLGFKDLKKAELYKANFQLIEFDCKQLLVKSLVMP
jgi:hypothetical protein